MAPMMTTSISDEFGHWLAGFIDGEGCFHIKRVGGDGGSFICTFIIGLRQDDRPILEEIRERTGLGSLYVTRRGGRAQVRWEVARKDECVRLAELLQVYPLRAKKARDLAIWVEALRAWQLVVARRRADWGRMREMKAQLEAGRVLAPDSSVSA